MLHLGALLHSSQYFRAIKERLQNNLDEYISVYLRPLHCDLRSLRVIGNKGGNDAAIDSPRGPSTNTGFTNNDSYLVVYQSALTSLNSRQRKLNPVIDS